MSDASRVDPAHLDAGHVQSLLQTRWVGRPLQVLAETGSTNDDLRTAAAQGATEGLVIVADRQQAGRGSHGRVWSSPGGTDLYVSLLVAPVGPPQAAGVVTLACGMAVANAIREILGGPAGRVSIKWPNDVLVDGRKCAGLLVETTSLGGKLGPLAIGIGLNVNRLQFEPALSAIATSMALAAPDAAPFDRAIVLERVLSTLELEIGRLRDQGPESTIERLLAQLAYRGEHVRVDDRLGRLVGVRSDGALMLDTEQGLCALLTGRVERA